ncbi:uncharacterized protein FFMR_00606 [Fusarium fujikuroi]|nr:uncharacterized protein FFMR_00606 [Fusarium fujikuroi]
MPERAKAY